MVSLTFFVETRVIQILHVQHVHVLLEQLDDFIQLFVVAVAVHEDFKLRVASFGFSGFYVYEVDMVFLEETLTISCQIQSVGAHSRMDAGTKKEMMLQFNHSFLVVFVRKRGKKRAFRKKYKFIFGRPISASCFVHVRLLFP